MLCSRPMCLSPGARCEAQSWPRRFRTERFPAFSAAVLALAVCPLPAPAQGSRADTTGLTRLRDAYVAAYNGGNSAAMEGLYTADAVRMPYDAPAQVGHDAILVYYRGAFAQRRFDPTLRLIPASVRVEGNLATERGTYIEVLKPKRGGSALVERGKYVAVLSKDDRGEWRYVWSIFNRDSPLAPRSTSRR